MTTKEKGIPLDYHSVAPFLIVKQAALAIDFYKKVFAVTELLRMTMPDDKIVFAELKLGESLILISDEFPETGVCSPKTLGGSPVRLHLYVEDVDALVKLALAAGGKMVSPLRDQFYGDRSGLYEDPFGHLWNLATRLENISRKEMLNRFGAMMRQLPGA
jgi:PhnB protein